MGRYTKIPLMVNFGKQTIPIKVYRQRIDSNADFQKIFFTWNRKVYHYALSKTSSTYIAEETVQRVFIKLWNNLYNKNITINLEAQIFCICKTTLLDILKEEKRQRTETLDNNYPILNSHCPQAHYQQKQLEQNLHKIIEKMPTVRKEVFQLSRFEKLSYKEIASKLSISPRTVENHISLALNTIRKAIYPFLNLLATIFILY